MGVDISSFPSRNMTFAIAVKNKTKANTKVLWSCPLLDFFTLIQIIFSTLHEGLVTSASKHIYFEPFQCFNQIISNLIITKLWSNYNLPLNCLSKDSYIKHKIFTIKNKRTFMPFSGEPRRVLIPFVRYGRPKNISSTFLSSFSK